MINSYNNTARGTRSYNSVLRQCQYSLSIGDLNANDKEHTHCMVIPFFEHSNEPNATALYEELNTSRDKVSASVREMQE